jgi:hypothetical protein
MAARDPISLTLESVHNLLETYLRRRLLKTN